jgi:hypothetical protein
LPPEPITAKRVIFGTQDSNRPVAHSREFLSKALKNAARNEAKEHQAP